MKRFALLVLVAGLFSSSNALIGITGMVFDSAGVGFPNLIVELVLTSGTADKIIDTTDGDGDFMLSVSSASWTGRLRIMYPGYGFTCAQATGWPQPVTANINGLALNGYPRHYTVQGSILTTTETVIPGATVNINDSLLDLDVDGWFMSQTFDYNQTIVITPIKPGWAFTPASYTIHSDYVWGPPRISYPAPIPRAEAINSVDCDTFITFVGEPATAITSRVIPHARALLQRTVSYDLTGRVLKSTVKPSLRIESGRILIQQ